jgi:hypothetical protein
MSLPRLALALLALSLAAPGAHAWTLYGADGTGETPPCPTRDGETGGAGTDGTMHLPGSGCSVTFDLSGSDVRSGDVQAEEVTYLADGDGGQVCGYLTFEGALEGGSTFQCSADGAIVTSTVATSTGNGTSLVVTWHSTSGSTDGIHLCAVSFTGNGTSSPPPSCAAWPASAHCVDGLTVVPGPGVAVVDWPDVAGTYYYNVSATRMAPEPVRLTNAAAGGFEGSTYTFEQPAATYAYSVAAFDSDHDVIQVFCPVHATVLPGAEVPFFTSRTAVFMGVMAVLAAGFILLRRRA